MKVSFTFDDRAIKAAVAKLAKAIPHDTAVDMLTRAAEPIRSTAADLAPRSDDPGLHLADHMRVAEASDPGGVFRDAVAVVDIGPEQHPKNLFYAALVEFGTAFHPARPFLRPAYMQGKKQALRILADETRRALVKALTGSR